MRKRRYTHSHRAAPLLSGVLLAEAVRGPAPEGEHWLGRTVGEWMSAKLGRPSSVYLGWAYLLRLDGKRRTPRPRHVQADAAEQATCKKKLRPLLREVATAFPEATVELWAVEEHRSGLKPILHKGWWFDGKRPLAPVQHRSEWRSLVGFVHPASGRTVFHLATTVNIPLFEAELAAFATAVGASLTQQIVLVLDRAGGHKTQRLRVPEQVHLLFLPPYSPELQPAEHLWPLTNTVLVNRHFASRDDLADAQAARCVALQARRDLVRSTTLFHWWPQRLKKRQGPRAC
jgi:transposase